MSDDQPKELEALIKAAVTRLDDEDELPDDPRDPPVGWWAIVRLLGMASRKTLDAAAELCRSADPTRRRVGAAVLGELGHTKPNFQPVFQEERYEALHALLVAEVEGDGNVKVLNGVLIALGHLHDARAIESVASLRAHPDAGVRFGVVHGLSGYDDDLAIHGLIELSADQDDDVRDWATFELGQMLDTDTPAIRDAFRARLNDSNGDVREEAIGGLARRKDREVIPSLIREIEMGVSGRLLEAATELADQALCGVLSGLKPDNLTWTNEQGYPVDIRADWQDAMKACGCEVAGK